MVDFLYLILAEMMDGFSSLDLINSLFIFMPLLLFNTELEKVKFLINGSLLFLLLRRLFD